MAIKVTRLILVSLALSLDAVLSSPEVAAGLPSATTQHAVDGKVHS